MRVGGIDVAARRGETTRVPYWAGLVLEKNNMGSMRLPDMISALKQALAKERIAGSRAFQALEPLFYVKLKAAMRHLEGRDYDRCTTCSWSCSACATPRSSQRQAP